MDAKATRQWLGLVFLAVCSGCLALDDFAGRHCVTDADCREGRSCLPAGVCGIPGEGEQPQNPTVPDGGPDLTVEEPPAPDGGTQTPTGPGSLILSEDFESFAAETVWPVSSAQGQWIVEDTGGGTVQVTADGTQVLSLAPVPSSFPGQGRIASVISQAELEDMDLTVRIRRGSGDSNFEVFTGIEWHATSAGEGYALRSNVIELALIRITPGDEEELESSGVTRLQPGVWSTVRVKQVGGTITVSLDGAPLFTVTDPQPFLRGRIRLLSRSEPARFDDLVVRQP